MNIPKELDTKLTKLNTLKSHLRKLYDIRSKTKEAIESFNEVISLTFSNDIKITILSSFLGIKYKKKDHRSGFADIAFIHHDDVELDEVDQNGMVLTRQFLEDLLKNNDSKIKILENRLDEIVKTLN